MTGQRGPRHTTAAPAATTSSAPARTATRHGVPVMMACPAVPTTVTAADPPELPPVVDPAAPDTAAAPGDPTLLAATLSTDAAVTPVPTATAVPAPSAASS